jgi:uncharacterized membrane protein YecN with MAPEG domain
MLPEEESPMAGVPIVALYGGLNAVFNIFLALRVSNARRATRTSVGLTEDKVLLLANRAHGNNAEFVPLAIVMLLICELQGGSSVALHSMGGALLVARVLHFVGLPMKAPNPPRFAGTAITWLLIVGAAIYGIVLRR